MKPPQRNLTPDSIRRECEASLRRLGVERIDLYQFHWPDTGTRVEDSWAEVTPLRGRGSPRGRRSNFDATLLERCEAIRHVDSLQPPFSLINRAASEKDIPWCAKHDTVALLRPCQSGLRQRAYGETRGRVARHDWRRRAAEFRQPRLGRNLALRDALLPMRNGRDLGAVIAIAWTLSWPG